MEVKTIISNILDSNTFVIVNNKKAIIVDCGAELDKVKTAVGSNKVEYILLTHEHYDHVFYVNDYQKYFNCKVFCSEETLNYIKNPNYNDFVNYPMGNELRLEYNSNFELLQNNQILNDGNFETKILYCPGHSKGSSCFLINNVLFTGDVLFSAGIGRYDLIKDGKQQTINTLNMLMGVNNYKLAYHGHGENSTYEKQQKNIRLFRAMLNKK